MTQTTMIRPASVNDASAFAALESGVAISPWSVKQHRESIHAHNSYALESEGRLAGFLVYNRVLDEVELLNVAIDGSFQQQGLGSKLINFLIDENSGKASDIFLEVRASNTPAIQLYNKWGFTETGRRKAYYPIEGGREDALVMRYRYG